MGLQAWYPLINDMRNQGVGDTDLIVETTPTFGVGKIGNALISGGNSHWTAAQSEKVLNNNAISICFWVYVDAPEGDTNKRAMFFGNNNKRNYALFQYPSCNDFHWSWYSYDSSNTRTYITGRVLYGALPSYEWTHIAITYNNPNGVVYINGEKKETFSGVMNNYTFSDQTPVIYQCQYRKLNDFRIYDHALSPREVKEISKGLVLHYPLAMPGGENIYLNSHNVFGINGNRLSTTSTCNGLISDDTVPGGKYISWNLVAENNATRGWYYYYHQTTGSLNLTENEIYTVSFYARCSKQKNMVASNIAESQTILNYDGSDSELQNLIPIGTIWKKHYVTFRYITTSKITTCFYLFGLDENVTLDIALPKLEHGSTPTSWIPNPADTEYSALGFNDSIEYDVSGYGHNGTKVGTITYDADTPRYETSAVFPNNCNTYIYTDGLKQQIFTWACWFKILGSGATTSQRIISEGRDTGSRGAEIWTSKDGTTLNYFAHGGGGSTAISLNTWYHVAMVCDGSNRIVYLNGNQIHSGTYTADIDYAQSSNAFVVGKMSYSYTQSSYYFPLNGQVSDVRIYATALSADDIKALYQIPISLSSNGTLFAGEFVEG